MHSLPLQVRFNDVDQMGHINNAVLMEYFDLGKEAFFSSIGLPPEQGDFTIVIVHFDVDFFKQMFFRDELQVRTEVARIGNKSLEVSQKIVRINPSAPEEVCAQCRTIMSGYCRSTGTSAPIPEKMKPLLLGQEGL